MPTLIDEILSKETGPERIDYFKDLMDKALEGLDPKPFSLDELLPVLIDYIKKEYDLKSLQTNEIQTIKKHLSTWDYETEDSTQNQYDEASYTFTAIKSAFVSLIEEESNALQLLGASENRGIQGKFLMGELQPKTALIPRDIQRFFTYEHIHGYNPEAFLSGADANPIAVYQRLYNIYNAHTNSEDNAVSNLDEFIAYFYQTQLARIEFSQIPKKLRIDQLSAKFNGNQIKPDVLKALMDSERFKHPTEIPEHPLIAETISNLSLYESQLDFPSQTAQTPPLNSADYEQFLMLAHAKLQTPEGSKLLENLILKCETNDTLWGLSSYCSTYHQLPFETLILDFTHYTQTNDLDSFTASMTQLLINLSKSDTHTLQLEGHLSAEQINRLIEVIGARNDIAIDIKLPPAYLHSEKQQQIDEILSDNIRNKKINQTRKVVVQEKAAAPKRAPKLRGKGNLSPQVDFELAEEEEQEEEQEHEVDVQDEEPPELAQGGTAQSLGQPLVQGNVTNITGFPYKVAAGEIDWLPGEDISGEEDDEKLNALWRNWVGALTNHEAQTLQNASPLLYPAACEALIKHHEQFQYGLDLSDLTQLPAGFIVREHKPNPQIDFDENLAKITDSDPLQVQLRPPPTRAALTHNQMNRLKKTFSQGELRYDRDDAQAYRQSCVPEQTASQDEKIEFLNRIKKGNEHISKQIEALQAAIPNLNFDALIQVYLTHGTAGFDKLLELKENNPNDFEFIHDTVFSEAITYASCLDSKFDKALKTIDTFSRSERVWFFKLLEEHCKAQTQTNLVDLVNAFAAFKIELQKISLPPGAHFNFYDDPQFSDTKSLPVTLSRMLYILKHVDEANREAQWQEISALDLSSTGAVKAFSATGEKEWAFITPEMQITQTHEVKNPTQDQVINYQATNSWTVQSIKKDFFRAIAFQPKGEQLPLAFYRHFENSVKELEPAIQIQLYQLIFKATTGLKKDSERLSSAEAEDYLDHLLTSVNGINPAPSLLSSVNLQIKVTLLEELNKLESPPKFPILSRLVSVIASCCTISMKDTLKENNEKLRQYVGYYGDSVYEGMRHYTEEQYKKPDLFFKHLETIEKIVEKISVISKEINTPIERTIDLKKMEIVRLNTTIEQAHNALDTDSKNSEAKEKLEIAETEKAELEKDIKTSEKKLSRYCTQLISLISTFNLKPNDIETLASALPGSPQNERVGACFDLLQQLNFNSASSPLTHENLLALIETIKNNEDQDVIDILADNTTISPHFPEGFLAQYNNPEVSDELKSRIETYFNQQKALSETEKKEQTSAVLGLLHRAGSARHYQTITDNIVAVCDGIKDKTERSIFLKKLTESTGVCPPIKPDTVDEPPLITLLSLIKTRKAHHDFIGLMNNERKANRSIERMPERAIAYIQDILPSVRAVKPRVIANSLLDPFIQTVLLNTNIDANASMDDYTAEFNALLEQINQIGEENPIIKKPLIALLTQAIQETPNLTTLKTLTNTLKTEFAKIADKNIVLSLCLHFSEAPHTPNDLKALLESVQDNPYLLKAAVAVLNTDKGYSLDDLKALRDAAVDNADLQESIKKAYVRAPYPSLKQMLEWHNSAEINLDTAYQIFDKYPAHREPESGFDANHAHKQLALMAANSNNAGFHADIINVGDFKDLTLKMRTRTSEKLLEEFKKAGENKNFDTLVAVAAELLYRSKGRDNPAYRDGQYELGSSMELNTTQYLAILTSLKTGTHVTSQMGTGEGKSRTMMVSAICQQAMGHTVDFVTSDIELAYRDFVEYKPLFDMVGAKSTMISSNSSADSYKMGGINFSDAANFNLFRNKAATNGQQNLVMAEDPTKRALLLDEADKTYFDMVNTRFNFSEKGNDIIINMPWVYGLLMEYMADEKAQALYQSGDVHAIRDAFLNYVDNTEASPREKARIHAVPDKKLDEWIDSAKAAQGLKFNAQFSITPDTKTGGRVSSEAKLKTLRVSSDAKFSRGVQQCLHARLNRAKKNPNLESDLELRATLAQCEADFFISNERQIIYSTSSKNFLDDYKDGRVQAVTGTAGSFAEREEAGALYGSKKDKMKIIELPRHQGLNRLDSPIRLARDNTQQIHYLIKAIIKAQADKQPILIFCENDIESAELMEKLQTHPHFPDQAINRIHGDMSKEEERAAVKKAGVARKITISTGMIGRGTDISLQNDAKENGLNVMVTYLPEERDLEQMIGRSGRFGKKGDTRLFLNKEKLKQQLGKKSLGSSGYYYNPEAYIRREQAIMTRKKQCESLIKNSFSDFKKTLQDNFFNDYLHDVAPNDKGKMKALWVSFIDDMDKLWNEQWSHIQEKLYENPIDIAGINTLLEDFQTNTQRLWVDVRDKAIDAEEDLLNIVPDLNLNESITALLGPINIAKSAEHKVYDRYDSAHDGRHVVYSSLLIPFVASLKGLWNAIPFTPKYDASETRVPFANIRAWWRGEGQIFPNLSYQINKLVASFSSDSEPKKTQTTEASATPDTQAEQEAPKQNSYDRFKEAGLVRKEKVVHAQDDLEEEFDEEDFFDVSDEPPIYPPLDIQKAVEKERKENPERFTSGKRPEVPPEIQEALDAKKKALTQGNAEDEDQQQQRDDSINGGP